MSRTEHPGSNAIGKIVIDAFDLNTLCCCKHTIFSVSNNGKKYTEAQTIGSENGMYCVLSDDSGSYLVYSIDFAHKQICMQSEPDSFVDMCTAKFQDLLLP